MGGHEGWFGFGGGFMWIFWILLIVLLVWIVRAAAGGGSGSSGSGSPPSPPETPLEILKKRYARGEIDEAEYERRKRELER